MDFGTRLKEMLQQRELTQKDFSAAINISPSAVGNYIRGLREPDYTTLKKIAAYFQVSTDFLLGSEIHVTCETDCTQNEREKDLVHIFRILDQDRQELLLEQAKVLLNRYGGNR